MLCTAGFMSLVSLLFVLLPSLLSQQVHGTSSPGLAHHCTPVCGMYCTGCWGEGRPYLAGNLLLLWLFIRPQIIFWKTSTWCLRCYLGPLPEEQDGQSLESVGKKRAILGPFICSWPLLFEAEPSSVLLWHVSHGRSRAWMSCVLLTIKYSYCSLTQRCVSRLPHLTTPWAFTPRALAHRKCPRREFSLLVLFSIVQC